MLFTPPPLTGENTILITTTLSDNEISEKRRKMLIDTMSKFGISVFFNHGVVGGYYIDVQYKVMRERMEAFSKMSGSDSGFKYAILCDDDFHCHSRFLEEINQTLHTLPPDWRGLHLSPGCLWGRSHFQGKGEEQWREFHEGCLTPESEYVTVGLDTDSTGRIFVNCGSGMWNAKHLWLGGPIAVLVRRETVCELLQHYTELYERENNPNDVVLTNILSHRDFVCREPQMGYEDEAGGSCFE
jgi:hypothetical protein